MSSGGGGRGGAGSAAREARQGSVKAMIQRLDGHGRDGGRHSSPSKRPRNDSDRGSTVSSSASIDDPAPGQPLTHQSLAAMMRTMSRQIRDDIADQFRVLREEISGMSDRIRSLEQHVDERDNYIIEMEQRLQSREERVAGLESEVDHLGNELRRKDLILSGPALPPPPAQAWTEDVTATAVEALGRFLPSVAVERSDIAESYRLSRGKRILCRFRECGKGSVRDRVYEGRFGARRTADAAGGDVPADVASPPGSRGGGGEAARPADAAAPAAAGGLRSGGHDGAWEPPDGRADTRLYVSENLTRKRQDIFQELLKLKRANQIYTVFTKNGEVFCKAIQYGRKIRVENLDDVPRALRG